MPAAAATLTRPGGLTPLLAEYTLAAAANHASNSTEEAFQVPCVCVISDSLLPCSFHSFPPHGKYCSFCLVIKVLSLGLGLDASVGPSVPPGPLVQKWLLLLPFPRPPAEVSIKFCPHHISSKPTRRILLSGQPVLISNFLWASIAFHISLLPSILAACFSVFMVVVSARTLVLILRWVC